MQGRAHEAWMRFYEHPVSHRVLPLRKKVVRLERALARAQRERDRSQRRLEDARIRIEALTRSQRQALKAYRRYKDAMQGLDRQQYGSLTPGFEGWTERWHEDRRRIVLFAPKDYGGSMVQWARAINASTEWAARAVTITPHQYGYRNDLTYGVVENAGRGLDELLEQADVIQIKDEVGFMGGRNNLPPDLLTRHRKPLVYTAYGSFARERQDDPEYRGHVDSFDATVSLTPDLCFPWLRQAHFIGHAVDTEMVPLTWTDELTVGHSPSRPQVKGTDLFLSAVELLQEHHEVAVDLIVGVSNLECIDRKAQLGLFFDQAGLNFGEGRVIGWYGNSALEAAARGIPTIAHLSDEALRRAADAGDNVADRCGIISCGRDVDSLAQTMRDYFDLDAEGRQEVSNATRRWVDDFHSFASVGGRLSKAYDQLV